MQTPNTYACELCNHPMATLGGSKDCPNPDCSGKTVKRKSFSGLPPFSSWAEIRKRRREPIEIEMDESIAKCKSMTVRVDTATGKKAMYEKCLHQSINEGFISLICRDFNNNVFGVEYNIAHVESWSVSANLDI